MNDQPKTQPAAGRSEAEIEELRLRRAEALKLGGAEAVAKHHGQGRLTIRERIDGLVDAGSFQEVGGLTGQGRYVDGKLVGVTPAPYVMGLAAIDGRPVAVGGEDFTVRGGTSWSGDRKKGGQGGFIEDLAASYRIPLVNLIDGSGGSVTSINRRGHAVFPGVHGFERSVELMGKVPVVSAVLGTAAGGPAGRAILSHWSVMVQRHEPGLRRGAAGGRALARPEDRQGRSGRRRARGRCRRHHRQSRRDGGGVLRADPAVPLLHAAERVGAAACRRLRPTPSTAARTRFCASCRTTAASPTTCAA